MCIICRKEYNENTDFIECCTNVTEIPNTLINLKNLNCGYTQIKELPNTLISLEVLQCDYTELRKIPNTFVNLISLWCGYTLIREIPEEFVKLRLFRCSYTYLTKIPNISTLNNISCVDTLVKFIPEVCKNLRDLAIENDNILVSPDTFVIEPNNKKYQIFRNCQKRYRRKFQYRGREFAYPPLYIIGYNMKKQLIKMLKG